MSSGISTVSKRRSIAYACLEQQYVRHRRYSKALKINSDLRATSRLLLYHWMVYLFPYIVPGVHVLYVERTLLQCFPDSRREKQGKQGVESRYWQENGNSNTFKDISFQDPASEFSPLQDEKIITKYPFFLIKLVTSFFKMIIYMHQ